MKAEEVEKQVEESKKSAKDCKTSMVRHIQRLPVNGRHRIIERIKEAHRKALAKIKKMNGENCTEATSGVE